MSNMNEGRTTDGRKSEDELAPTSFNPVRRFSNLRDETDVVSRQPVGRCLTRGFLMMSDDEIVDDDWKEY